MNASPLGLGLGGAPSAAPEAAAAAPILPQIAAVAKAVISPLSSPRSGSPSESPSPPATPLREGAQSPPRPEGTPLRSPAQAALDRAIANASESPSDLAKLQQLKDDTLDADPAQLRLKASEIAALANSQEVGAFYCNMNGAISRAIETLSQKGESSEIAEFQQAKTWIKANPGNLDSRTLVALIEKLLLLGCMLPNGELLPRSPQARPATPSPPPSPHEMALINLKDAANSTHIDDVGHQRAQFNAMVRVRFVAAAVVCVVAAILGIVLHKGFVLVAYVAYEVAKIAYNALYATVFSRTELRKHTFLVWLVAGKAVQSKFTFKPEVDHPVVAENKARWNEFLTNCHRKTYLSTIPSGDYDPKTHEFKIDGSIDARVALHDEITPIVEAANAAHEEVHFMAQRDEKSATITITVFTCGYHQNARTAESPPLVPVPEPEPAVIASFTLSPAQAVALANGSPLPGPLVSTPQDQAPSADVSMALVPAGPSMALVPVTPKKSSAQTPSLTFTPLPNVQADRQPTPAEQAAEQRLIDQAQLAAEKQGADPDFESV